MITILLMFATHRGGNMSAARHQGNQGYQWLKINVDARRALSIIFFNLRFLLIELIFATRSRFQLNQANQKTIKKES